MKKINWKALAPYLTALVIFIGLTLVYCSPILEGKVLSAGDTNQWLGSSQEVREYKQATGETSWWTNSMFGGMPTYQITGSMPSQDLNSKLVTLTHLGFTSTLAHLIGYFVGFFLMLICFGINPWFALVGSIAITFSSYFFVIIPAGHATKAMALGYLAPVFGGFYAIFRKKYWLGAPMIALFGTVGIVAHPQMTYYVFMMIGLCACAELYIHITEKRWRDLAIGVGVLALALLLVVGTKASWLKNNTEYLTETMRGGHSELTTSNESQTANGEQRTANSGLDIGYATAWSYDIDETLTLLVPNVKGGSSHYAVGDNSEVYKAMVERGVPKKQAEGMCQSLPMYWGTQPFTSGPVYVGAIICFLFVLGLIIVKGPYKWALLTATIFSILLAWGHNFLPLTELFFNYFPMYNKFRAVSSILIVAEIAMPLLGFLALQTIYNEVTNGEQRTANYARAIYISAGITGGICLLLALLGGTMWDFSAPNDAQMFAQMPAWFNEAIIAERQHMLTADAWRSFIFIALAAAALWLYQAGKLKTPYLIAIVGVLILVDMWGIDKRYFNNDHFVTNKTNKQYFAEQPWEKQLAQDKDPNYRVLNLTSNTFNESRTSYRHKSIGGYHAAKLRRYQDLIDAHISKNNMAVLNMLNTKYFITQQGVMPNPAAMGNAWFIDTIQFVGTPNEESAALWNINLHTTAVADNQFENVLATTSAGEGTIRLTSYAPNKLTYQASSNADKVAVFSEIYYPHGWHAYIDGQEVEIGRVNYVLRALNVPAGEHTITMEFIPDAMRLDGLSMACVILIILLAIGGFTYPLWKTRVCKKKE